MSDLCRLECSRAGGEMTMEVKGTLAVAVAADLRRRLLEELTPPLDTVLRIECVERIDITGVQILLAARDWLSAHGRKLTIIAVEGPVLRALHSSGVSAHLDIRSSGVDSGRGGG